MILVREEGGGRKKGVRTVLLVLAVDDDGALAIPDLLGEPETSEAGEGGSLVLPQPETGGKVGEGDVDEDGRGDGEEGRPEVGAVEELWQ